MLVLSALRDHVVFFYGPIRYSGKGKTRSNCSARRLWLSMTASNKSQDGIRFQVTDQNTSIEVRYSGHCQTCFVKAKASLPKAGLMVIFFALTPC